MTCTAVSELMRSAVAWIRPESSAAVALEKLAAWDAESLPVVDADSRLLGLVTSYELLKADLNGSFAEATVGQLMHPCPASVGPSQPVQVAEKLFREAAVLELPVLQEGRLVGVLERRTLIRWLASRQRARFLDAPHDALPSQGLRANGSHAPARHRLSSSP